MDCWMKYSSKFGPYRRVATLAAFRALPHPCALFAKSTTGCLRPGQPRSHGAALAAAALEHESEPPERLRAHRGLGRAGRHDDGNLDLGRDVDRGHLHAAADAAELVDDLAPCHVHGKR